ncbi:MAG TPA: pilin [Chitinophagaceae bacterium]|nr:pilin [Agitococcus sp.]HMY00271.1 pilin [Agitococcus sp.]HNA21118.1 pilin [Agitococcus sp.]HNF30431.1 pilin [Chitinophagaceae bacterium]
MKAHNGFTLIELMITVAIIGVLMSIGLPLYARYQDKARIQASLYEISAPKAQFEVQVNEGNTNITLADLGITSSSSANCTLITFNYDSTIPEWSLTCTLKGSPLIANRTISAVRNNNGTWSCKTAGTPAIPTDLKPSNCT